MTPGTANHNFDQSSIDDPQQRRLWIEFYKEQFAQLTIKQQKDLVRDCGTPWYEDDEFLRSAVKETPNAVMASHAARFRVFCLTTSPSSLLMWAHYADKHNGYCVEFDATKEKLRQARENLNTRRNEFAITEIGDIQSIQDGQSFML